MKEAIKVGFCVAYDWPMLAMSIPLIYEHADTICVSVDKDRQSWSGNRFTFDDHAFYKFLTEIDKNKKIRLYEASFYNPDFTPGRNEVEQRRKMAEFLGPGGWHIQLDCDEYLFQFEDFVAYLNTLDDDDCNVCCPIVTLFKEVQGGFLYVRHKSIKDVEYFQIATRNPQYEFGRRDGKFNVYTNFLILHQSWARSEDEVLMKLRNWGHSGDFNVDAYFSKWKSITASNYQTFNDFHPIRPELWKSLDFMKVDIDNFSDGDQEVEFPKFNRWQLLWRNKRLLNKIRALWNSMSR